MIKTPCIISVAITGSVPRKRGNPALPVTVTEQIESTHAAYEAGAALVQVHVRNIDESPSSDPALFVAFQDGIRRHCPDIIMQFSTGGRGRALEQKGSMLYPRPDMARLTTGSVNFLTTVYENPPHFVRTLASSMRDLGVKPEVEVFDLAMLYNTANLVAEGLSLTKPHVQFVFGVKHALPAQRYILEFEMARRALEMGGHCRTGLEDNIRLDQPTLAPSNAALVARLAKMATESGRRVATPGEARIILGLA